MTTTTTEPTISGLHPTTPESLPFAPEIEIRAFLLERNRGNLLIYSTGSLDADVEAIRARGGIERQYLNHWHESMFGLVPASLGARLIHHEAGRRHVSKRGGRGAAFSRRHHLDEDFEAIPTPGHTPDATAYLWTTAGQRLLFTGDTIMIKDGEWIAAVLESSDRERYIDTLELIRELEFDVLVPWAASAGGPFMHAVDEAERRERIDAILERVRAGAEG
jgi:glyoxylase-like metal-dependent hydrolase (beta-lactamase superfamily II)